jgi:hypothetical protein
MHSPDPAEFTANLRAHGNKCDSRHTYYGMTTIDGGCRKAFVVPVTAKGKCLGKSAAMAEIVFRALGGAK